MSRSLIQRIKTGTRACSGSRFAFSLTLASSILFLCFVLQSCSVFATRPVQDMSDTEAALRAAKEVQADTLAPELYRQANEWFFKSRNEYRFKNFANAKDYAIRSRRFAEQAEFEALRNGGNRTDVAPVDQAIQTPSTAAGAPATTPTGQASAGYDYPTPTGTPATEYDARKAEDEARKQREAQANQPTPTPTATDTPAVLVPPTYIAPTTTK
jgi:hypothetical protein